MRPNEFWTHPDEGAARAQAPGCQGSSCRSVRRGRGGDWYNQQRAHGKRRGLAPEPPRVTRNQLELIRTRISPKTPFFLKKSVLASPGSTFTPHTPKKTPSLRANRIEPLNLNNHATELNLNIVRIQRLGCTRRVPHGAFCTNIGAIKKLGLSQLNKSLWKLMLELTVKDCGAAVPFGLSSIL